MTDDGTALLASILANPEEDKLRQLAAAIFHLEGIQLSWWRRLLRLPTQEMRGAVNALHSAIGIVSAHVEFCRVNNRQRCLDVLGRAEEMFASTLSCYRRLNRWGYLV